MATSTANPPSGVLPLVSVPPSRPTRSAMPCRPRPDPLEPARPTRLAQQMRGVAVGQLHALARFATADGKGDLELPLTAAWAKPAAKLLSPLLGWADPDIVYVTYGKVWLPVFVAFTLCASIVHRRRRPAGFERWTWRMTIAGYAVASVGVLLDYWTQWTGDYNGDGIEGALFTAGWIVSVPGCC